MFQQERERRSSVERFFALLRNDTMYSRSVKRFNGLGVISVSTVTRWHGNSSCHVTSVARGVSRAVRDGIHPTACFDHPCSRSERNEKVRSSVPRAAPSISGPLSPFPRNPLPVHYWYRDQCDGRMRITIVGHGDRRRHILEFMIWWPQSRWR